MAGHVNAGRHQPALEAALLDVVGMAQRSAHAGARGGVRVGRVTECSHSTTLRRVRRSVRRRDDGETAQQQARVQAARWLGRLEQHEQHDTHGACGEREHLRAVQLVRWHAGALVQWRSGAVVQRCSGAAVQRAQTCGSSSERATPPTSVSGGGGGGVGGT